MTTEQRDENELPGASLNIAKMPGHWLLGRLGKRVLRPGVVWKQLALFWRR